MVVFPTNTKILLNEVKYSFIVHNDKITIKVEFYNKNSTSSYIISSSKDKSEPFNMNKYQSYDTVEFLSDEISEITIELLK